MTVQTSGIDALKKALALAARSPATAAAAAVLVSLGTIASPTQALAVNITPQVTVDTVIVPGRTSAFFYTVTNNSLFGVTEIEIPELNAGDFILQTPPSGGGTAFGLPTGWSATEALTPALFATGGGLYSGQAGAYIDIIGGTIGASGGSATFELFTQQAGSTNAQMKFFANSDVSVITVDPPIPGTSTSVPEPASMGLLGAGLLGLFGFARRRRS